ncbi:StAR-related lipid transfer protein 7, mitochondrial [Schistosoma japonicum]|nr:StAR-related lipid transfer protein 7, mitochondrial [Schistosoma japonicum]
MHLTCECLYSNFQSLLIGLIVCGQFNDISASSFLEVQLNLDYRRRWDDKIVELHCLTPHDRHSNDFDIIRWVVRFPFPMVNREYIYLRRWWMQPVDKFCMQIENSLASHKKNPSQSVIVPQNNTTVNNISTKRYAYNGLNYYLIYYDDPCLPISGSPMKLFSVKAIEEFMAKLHKAAVHLCNEGLPVGIYPIIYNNNNNDNRKKVDPNPIVVNESFTKDKPFNGRKLKSYFFTDPRPSEPNNYIDSTSAALS